MGFKDATSDSWMGGNFYTYLLLRPGTDLKKMESKFPDMVAKCMGPADQQEMGLSLSEFRTKGSKLGFALQPLTSIHLPSSTNNEFEPGGNATYVYIFAGVALFMLIVACINFINLSTAGAAKRAKEVGIRKVGVREHSIDQTVFIRISLDNIICIAYCNSIGSWRFLHSMVSQVNI